MTLVTGLAFDEWIARHRTHHQFCQDEARDPDMAVAFVVSLTESSSGERRAGAIPDATRQSPLAAVFPLRPQPAALLAGRGLREPAALPARRRDAPPALRALVRRSLRTARGAFHESTAGLLDSGDAAGSLPRRDLLGEPHRHAPDQGRGKLFFFEHRWSLHAPSPPPAWDWLFGGLNFQIEHHLFPQCPLAAWLPCRRSSGALRAPRIAYHGVSWREALRSSRRTCAWSPAPHEAAGKRGDRALRAPRSLSLGRLAAASGGISLCSCSSPRLPAG